MYYQEEMTLAEIGQVIGVERVARVAAAVTRPFRGCAPSCAGHSTAQGGQPDDGQDPVAGGDRRAARFGGDASTPAGSGRGRRAAIVRYNFRRPDRVSKEQIRSLHFLHERFARNVSTSLSAYLRAVTEVGIVSVEQFTYSEFLMSLPDPTAFYAVSHHALEGVGALEMNPSWPSR